MNDPDPGDIREWEHVDEHLDEEPSTDEDLDEDGDEENVDVSVGDTQAIPTSAAQPPPPLYYPTVEVFVRELLAPAYRRQIGHHRSWCPAWWRHTEAVARLEALWRSWEYLRLDPTTGISVWFRDHADHHMTVLLDPDGPFKYCSPEKGHVPRLEALPLEEPPEGLFRPPLT